MIMAKTKTTSMRNHRHHHIYTTTTTITTFTPIAKIPPGGYKTDQYSKSSIQWLEWVSHRQGVRIQHALNGGEKSLAGSRYKSDGYCQESQKSKYYRLKDSTIQYYPTDLMAN